MSEPEAQRPEWTPPDAGAAFASKVLRGVTGGHDGMPEQSVLAGVRPPPPPRRRELAAEDYVAGIRAQDRAILARAITLVESNAPAHAELAQAVLRALLPESGRSIRVGITGVPGAGKSTTIETLGTWLCEQGRKVAVLAVDPSSTVTRGSILGDKTRMEKLSRHPNAFIRPSPSGGTLGGVTRKSRETVILCEAFGFDTILLETVGVGQNEVTVRSMVDFFLLLMIAGAGDELQGIKKGVIELADALVVNKCDGDNAPRARLARAEFERVLHFLAPATDGWKTPALTCSARTSEGLPEVWQTVTRFVAETQANGAFEARRRHQGAEWFRNLLDEAVRARFYRQPAVEVALPRLEHAVAEGRVPAAEAVQLLLRE